MKKLSEWRKQQMFLNMRAKFAKQGTYIWISQGKNGLGLTYRKNKNA